MYTIEEFIFYLKSIDCDTDGYPYFDNSLIDALKYVVSLLKEREERANLESMEAE